ncbi:MAG: hypothetical protein AAB966_03940 [Patescibacteria group bacterium]
MREQKDYEGHDKFIKAIYSLGTHDKSDIVMYEGKKDCHFLMYIHIYNHQIMLDKKKVLSVNSWYHPAPHDFLGNAYETTVFKTPEDIVKLF